MARRVLPLPLRLVATYTVLVLATLLIVAALVVYMTRSHLQGELERRITGIAESFEAGPARAAGDKTSIASAARDWLATNAFSGDELVAVRVGGGRVLTATGNLDLKDLGVTRAVLLSTTPRWWELTGDRASSRALTVPLKADGRAVGTLVVAASTQRIDETLAALLRGMGIAAFAGLAFAAILGFITVRRTLLPLRRVAAAATAIEETADVTRRVGYEGPADEVGTLAATFDAMLGRLEEAFASQRRFLSDASHELRTPLTVVRGQLELLGTQLEDASSQRAVGIGIDEVDRMGRIVEDLLLLARLDEGIPLRAEPIEVELVVQEAVLRGMLIARRDISVEVDSDLYAIGDFDRLLQVLTNLITNAIHHAGESAKLTITGKRSFGATVIDVTDTGRGIPPEDVAHVFERLYRGSRPQTDAPAGAGLGLAIAASLTRAMGGSIRVASTPGVGTTFSVTMPAPVDAGSSTARTQEGPAIAARIDPPKN
jgi:signal transduction histidine kinase